MRNHVKPAFPANGQGQWEGRFGRLKDQLDEKLEKAQLLLLQSRLVSLFGAEVIECFRIIPGFVTSQGQRFGALLMDGRLPLHVPMHNISGCWPTFYLYTYDVHGRLMRSRFENEPSQPASFTSLGQAMDQAHADYRQLRQRCQKLQPACRYGLNVGNMPEEQWLHEQLYGQAEGSAMPEAAHGAFEPADTF